MVRADRRGAAGEEVVVERVSREFRLGPGIHRRVELAGDVRITASATARRSSARGRSCAGSTATCGRCSASDQPEAGGIVNDYPFVRQGWSRQPARRLLARREGQPDVAVAAAAGGVRAARDGQAADGEGRRRRGRQRQGRLHLRRDRQQGSQRARRVLRLRRVHLARQPRRRRDQQRLPLGHRRRACRRARACG